MILLDTDHTTFLKYPDSERGRRMIDRLNAVSASEVIGVAIVTVEERMRGWLAVIAKEKSALRQVVGYRELALVRRLARSARGDGDWPRLSLLLIQCLLDLRASDARNSSFLSCSVITSSGTALAFFPAGGCGFLTGASVLKANSLPVDDDRGGKPSYSVIQGSGSKNSTWIDRVLKVDRVQEQALREIEHFANLRLIFPRLMDRNKNNSTGFQTHSCPGQRRAIG